MIVNVIVDTWLLVFDSVHRRVQHGHKKTNFFFWDLVFCAQLNDHVNRFRNIEGKVGEVRNELTDNRTEFMMGDDFDNTFRFVSRTSVWTGCSVTSTLR